MDLAFATLLTEAGMALESNCRGVSYGSHCVFKNQSVHPKLEIRLRKRTKQAWNY